MLDWVSFQALAALYPETLVRLSGDSLALFLCTVSQTEEKEYWIGETTRLPDATEWDAIEALTAKAYGELMVEEECPPTMPLGMIFPFGTTDPPVGSLECDGTEYLRVDYPALYAALDAAFVVDADHFVTPDLRGRVTVGAGAGSGLTAYDVGETGGEEAHTLVTDELPYHTHTLTDPSHDHTYFRPNMDGAAILSGTQSVRTRTQVSTGAANADITPGFTGADTPHENRQPFVALRFAIWSSI